MGRQLYGPMHERQLARQREVIEGRSTDTLFLLEHDPVVTQGRNGDDQNLIASRELLESRGVEVFRTGRGGDVTFHGPGQLVGYPIVQLQEGEQDIRAYVRRVEELVIRTCADFGVQAERVEGLRGVWVGNNKIGAVGIRVARWTTMHGFALNVSTDLSFFDLIVPCGIHGRGVISLERLLGREVSVREVEDRVVFHAAAVFDRVIEESQPAESQLAVSAMEP